MVQVVVVDTDTSVAQLMQDLLEQQSFDVVVCSSADAAFPLIRRERPAAVILDVWLDTPESGWYVLQRIKTHPATNHIPVIVCTGALEQLRARSAILETYAQAVLAKPFDIWQFEAAVTSALARRELAAE